MSERSVSVRVPVLSKKIVSILWAFSKTFALRTIKPSRFAFLKPEANARGVPKASAHGQASIIRANDRSKCLLASVFTPLRTAIKYLAAISSACSPLRT